MASAHKKRDRKLPVAEFDMSLADVIDAIMHPQDVEPGDEWTIVVAGDTVLITRHREPEELPVEPEAQVNSTRRRG